MDSKLIKSRTGSLREKGNTKVKEHLINQVGKEHAVLMENENLGRSEQFTEIIFETPQIDGQIITARVTGVSDDKLIAEPASP
mgnify:CR=1 FL=1